MKIIIIIALLGVLLALAFAVYFMLSRPVQSDMDEGEAALARSRQMAKALKWRVIISLGIFAMVLVAYALGWIQPNGTP